MNPFFSVIIPTYNRAYILERAINSVLVQTFSDFELIIVDDGSNDNTKDLISNIHDSRIVYMYQANKGQNAATNAGIDSSKGKVLAFLDSDDYWLQTKLEKVYKKYNDDNNISVVYHWTGIEKNGDIILAREDCFEGDCYNDVLKTGYLTSPTFLTCKKACFDIIGHLDERITNCQDDDLCFSLCRHFKVGLVKEVLGTFGDSNLIYDRVTSEKNKKKNTISEMLFWDKWCDEVVKNVDANTMIKRYLKCAGLFLECGEVEYARGAYEKAEDLATAYICSLKQCE